MKYTRVAMRADLAQENASQVPHSAVIHAWSDDGRMAGTLCNATVDVREVQIVERNRVVSCPMCLEELRKRTAATKRFDVAINLGQADAELTTILYQRAGIALERDGNWRLSKALENAAQLLHADAMSYTIPHDTSVPQAGDAAVIHDKDCGVCGGSGTAFGKVCDCKAAAQAAFYAGSLGLPYEGTERRTRPRFIEVDLDQLRRDVAASEQKAATDNHAEARAAMQALLVRVKERYGAPTAKALFAPYKKMCDIPDNLIERVTRAAEDKLTPPAPPVAPAP